MLMQVLKTSYYSIKNLLMLTYDLNRMKERFVPEVANLIDCCIKEVCDKTKKTLNGRPLETNYHALELWNLLLDGQNWNIEVIQMFNLLIYYL